MNMLQLGVNPHVCFAHHDVIPNLFMLCSWFAFLAGYVHDGLDSHGIKIGIRSIRLPMAKQGLQWDLKIWLELGWGIRDEKGLY